MVCIWLHQAMYKPAPGMQYEVLDMKPVSEGFFSTYWSIFHDNMLLYTETNVWRFVCAQSSTSHLPWTHKTPPWQPVTGPAAPLWHRAGSTAAGCAAQGHGAAGSTLAARVPTGAWRIPRKQWEPAACYWVDTRRERGGTGILSLSSLNPVQQRKGYHCGGTFC